jgi:hypothetical protein
MTNTIQLHANNKIILIYNDFISRYNLNTKRKKLCLKLCFMLLATRTVSYIHTRSLIM